MYGKLIVLIIYSVILADRKITVGFWLTTHLFRVYTKGTWEIMKRSAKDAKGENDHDNITNYNCFFEESKSYIVLKLLLNNSMAAFQCFNDILM